MDIQRVRNLTTLKLHTKIQDIYEDIEFLTNEGGIMTHMLPNACTALRDYLKDSLTDERFWDGKFDINHVGDVDIKPMGSDALDKFIKTYRSLPNPLS